MFGYDGHDTLRGDGGDDALFGGAGDDSMLGGEGADQLEGENGNDTLAGELGSDSLYGGQGEDRLYGGDGDNALYGGTESDVLQGDAGNDTLEGGTGTDTLEGGAGNDQYAVSGLNSVVRELAGQGIDTVRVSVSIDLGAVNEIEILSTTNQAATTALDLAADDTANEIRGNNGVNILTGRGGDDRMFGYDGHDTLDGGAGDDSLLGGAGDDSLSGGAGNDTLNGEGGQDTLDGGDGDDSFAVPSSAVTMYGGNGLDTLRGGSAVGVLMDGGAGDDSYYVEHSSARVVDAVGGGIDTVRTTVSFELEQAAEIEFLRVTDQASITALDLTGSASTNELRGNNGNNRLNGGGGEDSLRGFAGNDTYIVDSLGDKVFEIDGEGDDTVLTSITFTLSSTQFVEHVHLADAAGTADLALTGNLIANDLRGNAGGNRLSGGDGDDSLTGLGGNDTVYGGTGSDRVILSVASTTVNAVAGASNLVLTSSEGVDFVSNDVEFFVFADKTLTYAEAALLRSAVVDPVRRGTTGADTLFGDGSNDTILGDAGNDSLVGNAGDDSIQGDADSDILRGNAGLDSLYGGTGNDTLYNNADAADTMDGGAGDDSYYVEHSSARVVDAVGGGIDTVRTTVSFELEQAAEIEFLRVTDQASITALDLTGSASTNELRGNNGNNRLNGGGGEDSLRGFAGNDTYIVDSLGDKVFEIDGEGDDTVLTSITFTLSSTQFVEHVHLADAAGTADLALTGNLIANDLRGNAGGNRLSGGDGDDSLTGLGGNDTVYGGTGSDRVILSVASTTVNAVAGASGLVLTSSEGVDFVSNDVELFVFADKTLTYAEAALLRAVVGPVPVLGTDSGENVIGTNGGERIDALGGNDWITPGTGSDTIDGGDGRDMVSFVTLPDTPGRTNVQYRLDLDLTAGRATTSGADVYQITNVERVTATIFADRIKGSAGADELRGLGDYDWFVATTGADIYDGGTGADMVSYVDWQNAAVGASVDPLLSNGLPPVAAATTGVVVNLGNTAGNTNLAAGHSYVGIERITGSGRADVFWGDDKENDFRGLGDYDWFVGSTGGRERYFGGDGVDTVTYFRSTAGVTASLSNGARVGGLETGFGTGGDAAQDLYFEIENLVGSNHGDALRGNAGRNTLMGLNGDDFLFGAAGIDILHGGAGHDTLDGGAGSDYAVYTGNRADYTLTRTSSNTVTITGTEGNDRLIDVEYFRFADGDVSIWSL